MLNIILTSTYNLMKTQSRDSTMVRAHASHQCGTGLIPGPGITFCPCFKGFSPGSRVFFPLQKPILLNYN